jgi:hypothetical protein
LYAQAKNSARSQVAARLCGRPRSRPPHKRIGIYAVAVAAAIAPGVASALEREMDTGIPTYASYSAATGVQTVVWGLTNPTIPFPSDCSRIVLTAATMGMDAYKIAVAHLLAARFANKRIRFYAHASRDDGCGIDYVQLAD